MFKRSMSHKEVDFVSYINSKPSQIACTVTTVYIMCMQTTLHVHKNLGTVLIENTTENYLLPAHTDHYGLRK